MIHKYPRTRHVEGSRLQPGDEDLEQIPFAALRGRHLVVEEKMDGANAALSFETDGELRLQSRGHYLTGGPRERHFDLFKRWAAAHAAPLHAALGARYVLYGEWLWAKHTIYYDDLPHYFLEFDVLDTARGLFLDTPSRRTLLAPLGAIVSSVLVLHHGPLASAAELTRLVGPSRFLRPSSHLDALRAECLRRGLDPVRALAETDPSAEMEGLYIKVEERGSVAGRFKYVRASFLQAVAGSESHWLERPIIPNRLRPGVDLFA